jgi:hypothetical protein
MEEDNLQYFTEAYGLSAFSFLLSSFLDTFTFIVVIPPAIR